MFGVVLWRDAKEGKAVFWCEDQGDLAYFEACDPPSDIGSEFDAGDMVQFDVKVEQRLRRASNARLVLEKAYSGLPDQLRQEATSDPVVDNSPKVLPFRPVRFTLQQCHQRPKRKA